MRQSMPSTSIDNCAGVSDTLPEVALGPDEAAALESLDQQHQASPIEPQQLDDVAAPAPEDEDMALERVLRKRRLHQRSQPIEALPHVGVARHDPHAGVGRQTDHVGMPRSTAITVRSVAGSAPGGTLTTTPATSTSMACPLDSVLGTGGPATITGSSCAAGTDPMRWRSVTQRRSWLALT